MQDLLGKGYSPSIGNPAIWIYPLLLQENVDPPFL